jgi:hypothetical protein
MQLVAKRNNVISAMQLAATPERTQ